MPKQKFPEVDARLFHRMFILCRKCKLAYPVLEDVPDMLIKDAWPLEKAGKQGFRHELRL